MDAYMPDLRGQCGIPTSTFGARTGRNIASRLAALPFAEFRLHWRADYFGLNAAWVGSFKNAVAAYEPEHAGRE